MGRLKSDQSQLFYEFCLGDAVPEDHLVRKIDAALDPSLLRGELFLQWTCRKTPIGFSLSERKSLIRIRTSVSSATLLRLAKEMSSGKIPTTA
jgi:hypothetical protein